MNQSSRVAVAAASFLGVAGIIGYGVTESMVPELPGAYAGDDHRAASTALRSAERCIENPLQRFAIQKLSLRSLHIDALEEGSVSDRQNVGAGLPRAALSSTPHASAEPAVSARVVAYTLYAVPVTEIVVIGGGLSIPGSCVISSI